MAVETVDDTGSLSDHEATYHARKTEYRSPPVAHSGSPTGDVDDSARETPIEPVVSTDADIAEAEAAVAEATDPNLRYQPKDKPRHRAKSQQARAEDVPEIQTLTRTLKEKQDELGKYRPANGQSESPRVTALRRQIRGLEAEIDEARPKPTPAKVEPIAAAPLPSAFTEPEPTDKDFPLDKFAHLEDPYGARAIALSRAQAAWDRKKEAFEVRQELAKSESTAAQKATLAKLSLAVETFAAKTPDWQTTVDSLGAEQPPPLLGAAITSNDGDKYPEFVYYLAKHPDVRAEMHFDADGKPVTPQNVAILRRRLEQRMQADMTGAVAPRESIRRPPVPPTPVRTGPLKTGDDPPDDGASLADHERFYHAKRRR